MKNCYKFKSLISNYIDKEISFQERIFFNDHIEKCSSCKTLFSSISTTKNGMQKMSKLSVNDNFMDSLRSKILEERNTKIIASQNTKYSFKRVPSFAYAFSTIIVIVLVGFTIMKISNNNMISVQQLPLATQEKINDVNNFQQQFNATPSYLKNNNLVNTKLDSGSGNNDNSVMKFENNLNKVGYQKK